MDKYGTSQKDLLESLRNEEHNLMLETMNATKNMMTPQKTASVHRSETEKRLQEVRSKITELDLGEKFT